MRVRVHGGRPLDLLSCNLKSKLFSFLGGRLFTRDDGERARFGACALNRRAAVAVTVREAVTGLLTAGGAGGGWGAW